MLSPPDANKEQIKIKLKDVVPEEDELKIDINLKWRKIISQKKLLMKNWSGIDADLKWKEFLQKKRTLFIATKIHLTHEEKYIETILIQQKQSHKLKDFYMILIGLWTTEAQSYPVDDCMFIDKMKRCDYLMSLIQKMPPDLSPYIRYIFKLCD